MVSASGGKSGGSHQLLLRLRGAPDGSALPLRDPAWAGANAPHWLSSVRCQNLIIIIVITIVITIIITLSSAVHGSVSSVSLDPISSSREPFY